MTDSSLRFLSALCVSALSLVSYLHGTMGVGTQSISHRLNNHRDSLPAPNARRRQPVSQSIPPQLIEDRNHQPRSRSSQRMAQSNRPALHLRLIAIDRKSVV